MVKHRKMSIVQFVDWKTMYLVVPFSEEQSEVGLSEFTPIITPPRTIPAFCF